MTKHQNRHSKSKSGSGILYRVRRSSSARSEIIPESEKSHETNGLTRIAADVAGKIKKPDNAHKKTVYTEPAGRVRTKFNVAAVRERTNLTRLILMTIIICGIIIACTFIFIPLAFASETTTINVNDGGREFTAETSAKTVGEFLDRNGITLGEYDMLDMSEDAEITEDMTVIIRRAMTVNINYGNEKTSVMMLAGTVGDALEMAGIEIQEKDEIYPETDTYVRDGINIDYIEVEKEYTTKSVALGFRELKEETDTLYKGETKLKQEGKEGEKVITFEKTYKNGTLVSTEEYSEEVTREPVNEITLVGTKEKEVPKKTEKSSSSKSSSSKSSSSSSSSSKSSSKTHMVSISEAEDTIDIDGKTYSVKGVYNSEVTAYCSHCDPSGVGASGAALTYGSLAADTSVFPFGTKIYIPGYGIGYVVDRGGGMNGTRIDVYMGSRDDESACNSWGRRNLKVYVLE